MKDVPLPIDLGSARRREDTRLTALVPRKIRQLARTEPTQILAVLEPEIVSAEDVSIPPLSESPRAQTAQFEAFAYTTPAPRSRSLLRLRTVVTASALALASATAVAILLTIGAPRAEPTPGFHDAAHRDADDAAANAAHDDAHEAVAPNAHDAAAAPNAAHHDADDAALALNAHDATASNAAHDDAAPAAPTHLEEALANEPALEPIAHGGEPALEPIAPAISAHPHRKKHHADPPGFVRVFTEAGFGARR